MTDVAGGAAAAGQRPTSVRHMVLWLTVLAYLITYMDRVVISTAAPSIQKEFGINKETMGWVLGTFQISYAMFQIPGGWLGDKFGPRAALAGVVTWWSAFTAATALTWSATSMMVCRFLFGMGEAGAFPIANRSLSRWMLPAERGFAQGLTHAGSRLGAAATPILVTTLIAAFSWHVPFFIFAAVGLLWAIGWYVFYRNTPSEHAMVNQAERDLIASHLGDRGKTKANVPWGKILSSPQMWLLSCLYFCYGYGIVIFLQWFPTYLTDARGFDLKTMGIAASLPLLAGVVGDLTGGWVSDLILKSTGNVKMARRLVAAVGFAIAAIVVPLAALQSDPILAVAWFSLAVFGLELVVGVAWAITLDIGDEFAGTVSAVMNTFGNVAGAFGVVATGYIASGFGWETALFVITGFAIIGCLLCFTVDASRKLFVREPA
jgi:MFS transporter, ACS family, glucarate transporter